MERIYKVSDLLQLAGNAHYYQKWFNLIAMLQWFFAAFIQMGFPILFLTPSFICLDTNQKCLQVQACSKQYQLDHSINSVVSQYGLICDKAKILDMCFNAFLIGGFIGCFWYGQIIQRKGRSYSMKQAMAVMICGLLLCLISQNITLFGIGIFFINFGFRGHANAVVNNIIQVTSDLWRQISPISLSLGWALGQITVGILGIYKIGWRIILGICIIPLIVLWVLSLKIVESPRFLIVKRQYMQAKKSINYIAQMNGNNLPNYQVEEQVKLKQKIKNYQQTAQIQIKAQIRHFSYFSIFRYPSVRIRTFAFSIIWGIISLSYFQSANTDILNDKSKSFNIALSGAIQICGCLLAGNFILNQRRIQTIKKILVFSAIIHLLFYFDNPLNKTQNLFYKAIQSLGDLAIRVMTTMANSFMLVFVTQAFPTVIRHYQLGFITFISRLAYALQPKFSYFWRSRNIHPYMVNGLYYVAALLLIGKLRETRDEPIKQFIDQDDDGIISGPLSVGLL